MRILLLGEYSGVHNNLHKALKDNNYEVFLISNGDSYKSFSSDIYIKYEYKKTKNKLIRKPLALYYTILAFSGFKGAIQIFKYVDVIKKMKDYDIVQLINPIFLTDFGPFVNFIVFLYLKKNNKKIFLCALGDDFYWVSYCLKKGFSYSMFDRLSLKTLKYYLGPLFYVYGFLNPFLNKYIVKNVNAVIPGLYDYYASYNQFSKCTSIVPIIIKTGDDLQLSSIQSYPIKIFHGWQKGKETRKGNDIFDKAIKKLIKKYPDKVEYNIVGGLSYDEYIKTFEDADIFIDQCFSQDKGVNALLGMSAGKVVFSGFEPCVKEYYNIDYDPVVNSLPDANQIFENLERLILDTSLIARYSASAKIFIKEFHNSDYVLNKYFKIWRDC